MIRERSPSIFALLAAFPDVAAGLELLEARSHVGECGEGKIGVHQLLALGGLEVELQALGCEDEAVLGHLPEVLVPPHQAPSPGVLQLLEAPGVAQGRSLAGEELLAERDDRMHIEQGAVRVEGEALDLLEIGSASRCALALRLLRGSGSPGERAGAEARASDGEQLQEVASDSNEHFRPPLQCGVFLLALSRSLSGTRPAKRRCDPGSSPGCRERARAGVVDPPMVLAV